MVWIVDNAVSMVEHFATAGGTDPLSALLVACGALLVTLSMGAFGALALGGVLSAVVPDTATKRTRRRRA
ncbi:MAG: hypothetical protein ABEJ88_07830 [Halobacterium sp.]